MKNTKKKKDNTVENEIGEPVNNKLYWVGIGASAGGLEAIRELVANIPDNEDIDVTYIVAQHLSPKHRSMLVQLVARETTLEVRQAEDGTKPEPNVMYMTPANSDVFVEDGLLLLRRPLNEYSPKPSVDHLFTSLAEYAGDHAVGIILSGTGSDGSHGVRAIRAAGGITIAQKPDSAKYDGMPKKAIETGCVDVIAQPDQILKELNNVLRSPNNQHALRIDETKRTSIQELLASLRDKCGVDFSDYKSGTLFRRINRRLTACGIQDLEAYVDYVRQSPSELEMLFKDLLISVTSFFRDAEAFDAARETIKQIIDQKSDRDSVRVWIPGCATGEEAYSVAMMFAEAAGGIEKLSENYNFQLFATDIDMDALGRARRGAYPEATMENVNESRKKNFFIHKEHTYQIIKSLRDLIVFSRHNIFEDPSFLRIDLIVCRNLLIYFNSELQHEVLNLFHYSLSHEGCLFLGKSESLGQSSSLFRAVDSKNKIYKRKTVTASDSRFFARPALIKTQKNEFSRSAKTNKILHNLPDAIIESLSPDSILIDENMDVIRVYGDVQAYTQLSSGAVTMNLASLARKEFRQELRALVYKIMRENSSETILPKKLNIQGEMLRVDIIIRPLHLKQTEERLLLVSFEKVKHYEEQKEISGSLSDDPMIAELEQELSATREHLQTVVEELETSNEELQSTNEEMQSTNEELQSSNEELETANEELQSTNEELITVNEELQVKTSELTMANEDLNNIKESIDFPLLVVDKTMRITRFNAAASEVFEVGDDNIGEILFSVQIKFEIERLKDHVKAVIESGQPVSRQIDGNNYSYYERILPYKNDTGQVQGAVLTYINNYGEREIERKLKASEERFDLAVRGSGAGIWDWNIINHDLYLSPICKKILGLKSDLDVLNFDDFMKQIHPDDYADVRSIFTAHLRSGFDCDIEFRVRREPYEYIWVHLRGQAIWDYNNSPYRMVGSIHDITLRKQVMDQLVQSNEALERFAYVCSHDIREPARVIENFADLFVAQYGDDLDEEASTYLNHMKDSSVAMQGMIRGILEYSQLAHKRSVREDVDVTDEIERVRSNLRLSIEETQASIIYNHLPVIKADRLQLFQIFQNLISNSIKFCKDKKPEIEISAVNRSNEWEFQVRDNGIGMEQKYADKIFDVFQRLNKQEEYLGAGIGLSICRKVVTVHGGRIWVESTPGEGSTFYFTIPKMNEWRNLDNVISIERQTG